MTTKRRASIWQALLPVALLMILLFLNVSLFSDDSSYGPNQIALLLSAALACVLAVYNGVHWRDLVQGMLKSINHALPSVIILLLIGTLAGTWLISGVVPAMIYYGLYFLSPKVFLVAACVVCMIVSLATGSSWSTAATVGVALIGIGKALGVSDGLVAGAVISGAYFGDKMSPLSDTTNLAPAVAGTDLFTHIRYMMYTTIPSISIALIIFFIIGLFQGAEGNVNDATVVQQAIASKFNLNPLLFVVPAAVIIMIVRKVSAMPALLVGSLLGAVFGVIFQYDLLLELSPAGSGDFQMLYGTIIQAMYGDISVVTENADVNDLLSSGGMMGMMFVILLVIAAMIFGGVMERAGFLEVMVRGVIKGAERVVALVASTAGTCIFFNLTTSEQYVSIVVPGRMFTEEYKRRKLPPELLSRTLEDSGTVTSVLVPWNSCGAYHQNILGVDPLTYLPYCFFNLISPIMTVLVTGLGVGMKKPSTKG